MSETIIVMCPNCNEFIIIEKLNCCIFRHAVCKETGIQIDPHSSKDVCEQLLNNNLILGCGKPFKIIVDGEKIKVEICEYI
jgi:hypothetical protein